MSQSQKQNFEIVANFTVTNFLTGNKKKKKIKNKLINKKLLIIINIYK